MKAGLLLTGNGALVYLTSHSSFLDQDLIRKFGSKGIEKFISYDIPIELAKERYGSHFAAVARDVHERDELRILDFNGQRAFSLFDFDDLGPPTRYQARPHITP